MDSRTSSHPHMATAGMTPFFSVLTPAWRRADYLEAVWHSLRSQTFESFEWIVGNDGSDDGTRELIVELATRSPFRIIFVDAQVQIGKARVDNLLVAVAQGELGIWCDSDDAFVPETLERLHSAWMAIPKERRGQFSGVAALAATDEGVLGRCACGVDYTDAPLGEIEVMVSADMALAIRTAELKKHPFPEVDLVVPESSVWCRLESHSIRFLPQVLKRVAYGQPFAISFSGSMRYNRGRAHGIGIENRYRAMIMPQMKWLWRAIIFTRYRIHGDISAREAARLWGRRDKSIFLIMAYLPALLLVFKDFMQGKVDKTHRRFLDGLRSGVHTRVFPPSVDVACHAEDGGSEG